MFNGTHSRGARCAAAIFGAFLIAGCQPAAQPPTATPGGAAAAPRSDEWSQLVDAAKKEGSVSVYAFQGTVYRDALVEPFERAFPGI